MMLDWLIGRLERKERKYTNKQKQAKKEEMYFSNATIFSISCFVVYTVESIFIFVLFYFTLRTQILSFFLSFWYFIYSIIVHSHLPLFYKDLFPSIKSSRIRQKKGGSLFTSSTFSLSLSVYVCRSLSLSLITFKLSINVFNHSL